MSSIAEFKIAYDGEALRSNSMDVRDLAPALLAFGKLFDEANRVINDNKTSVRLQVKATTAGSFNISFLLDQSFLTQITGFLTGEPVTAAANLITLLGFGSTITAVTLLTLIRWLKGDKPSKITDLKNGMLQIEYGTESLTVPLELLRLYQDIAVRKATEEILEPLKSKGIDTFRIIDSREVVVETITKSEIIYYKLPEIEDEIISQAENITAYSIISLAFKEDRKWRLYDGNSAINVTLSDNDFLYKVDNNLVSFAKGDILICNVKTTQYRTNTGLKTEYEVLHVKEHKPAARQLSLFDEL